MESKLQSNTLYLKTFNPYVVVGIGGCACEKTRESQRTFIDVAKVPDTDLSLGVMVHSATVKWLINLQIQDMDQKGPAWVLCTFKHKGKIRFQTHTLHSLHFRIINENHGSVETQDVSALL